MLGLVTRYWVLGLLIVACSVSGYAGWSLRANKCDAALAAQVQADAQAYKRRTEDFNAASAALEVMRHEHTVLQQQLQKRTKVIATRPVYRNVCLDPDGVSIINEAARGKPASAR